MPLSMMAAPRGAFMQLPETQGKCIAVLAVSLPIRTYWEEDPTESAQWAFD